jgi:hypothetical protein
MPPVRRHLRLLPTRVRGAPKCKPPNRACGKICMKPAPPFPGGRYCKRNGEVAPKKPRGSRKKSGPGQVLYVEKPKCRGPPFTKPCGRRCIAYDKVCPPKFHQWLDEPVIARMPARGSSRTYVRGGVEYGEL